MEVQDPKGRIFNVMIPVPSEPDKWYNVCQCTTVEHASAVMQILLKSDVGHPSKFLVEVTYVS